jgi:hypothetical protein
MKYNYPHTGNDKLLWQERFWSPSYVASNGGTVTGSLSFNGGATFDGTAKYIDYLRRDHGFPAQWTMMADINLYDLIGDFTILSRDATSPTLSQFCVSVVGGRLKVTIGWTDGTYSTLLDQINHINVGIRQHVAVTYDGVTIRTFVCGVAGSTLAVAGKKLKRSVTAFRVGARASVGYENYFKGTIKELRVYGTALSLSDFQALWLEAQGEGAALSVPPVLDGLVLWVDPRTGGTPATQPAAIDWDMEAVGISSWMYASLHCLPSKQTSGCPKGNRYLRITSTALNPPDFQWAWQVFLVPGQRYFGTGFGRGVNQLAYVNVGGQGSHYTIPANNIWKQFLVEHTPETGRDTLYLGATPGTIGGITEWDDITFVNLSRASITPSSLGTLTAPLVNASATTQPWISNFNGKQYLQFASDILLQESGSDKLNCLHNGLGVTAFIVTVPTTMGGQETYFNTTQSSNSIGFRLLVDAENNAARLAISNGSGTYDPLFTQPFNGAFLPNTVNRVMFQIANGTNNVLLERNGVSLGTRTITFTPSLTTSSQGLLIAGGSGGTTCRHGHILIYNRILTATEKAAMNAWLAAEYP